MAQAAAPAQPVSLLCVDFDDTITDGDTISIILYAAVDAAGAQDQGEAGSSQLVSGPLRRQLAERLAREYGVQYDAFMCERLPELQAASPAYSPEAVASFLLRLSDFDARMVDVVEQTGVLAGISQDTLPAAGAAKVRVRPGSLRCLARAAGAGVAVHVLSVNWSTGLLRGALGEEVAQAVTVHANDLKFADGVSTGRISQAVVNAADKERVLRQLRRGTQGVSVAIGDSVSDLGCLLAADVGIVFGSSGSLQRVLAAAGIATVSLPTNRPLAPLPRGQLYATDSWVAVETSLFGQER